MTPQSARDMGQDAVPVLEFDRKRRAREDLLDRPEDLE
jgi:hypothetical protein